MKILFDTNVILDVLLQREPWRADADALWKANDAGKLTGFITATTITDIFYIARKLPPGAERAFQRYARAWRHSRFARLGDKRWSKLCYFQAPILKTTFRSFVSS